MLCKYCNGEIEENMKFCPMCGKEIDITESSGTEDMVEEMSQEEIKVEDGSQDKEDEYVYIPARDSSYNFRLMREKYKENGGKFTDGMIGESKLDIYILIGLIVFAVIILIANGGINPTAVRFLLRYSIVCEVVIWCVSRYEGKVYVSIMDTENKGEKAAKTILEMSEPEIEMRESRRKRNVASGVVGGIVLFALLGEPLEENTWMGLIESVFAYAIASFIFCLPVLYFRHRATKRLQSYLAMKDALRNEKEMIKKN